MATALAIIAVILFSTSAVLGFILKEWAGALLALGLAFWLIATGVGSF